MQISGISLASQQNSKFTSTFRFTLKSLQTERPRSFAIRRFAQIWGDLERQMAQAMVPKEPEEKARWNEVVTFQGKHHYAKTMAPRVTGVFLCVGVFEKGVINY